MFCLNQGHSSNGWRYQKTIRRFIGEAQIKVKTAKIPTSGGIQGGDLLDEDAMLETIIKYKPELFKQFAKLGLR